MCLGKYGVNQRPQGRAPSCRYARRLPSGKTLSKCFVSFRQAVLLFAEECEQLRHKIPTVRITACSLLYGYTDRLRESDDRSGFGGLIVWIRGDEARPQIIDAPRDASVPTRTSDRFHWGSRSAIPMVRSCRFCSRYAYHCWVVCT